MPDWIYLSGRKERTDAGNHRSIRCHKDLETGIHRKKVHLLGASYLPKRYLTTVYYHPDDPEEHDTFEEALANAPDSDA